MYNGVGLQTPRGSGTSGYIQTNKSYIRQKSRLPQNDRELLAPPKPKKANRAILEHDRQRQIELQLTIYREQLESRNYSEKEIEKKVAEKRKEVMMAVDSQKLTRNDLNDTHSVAKAKEEESERLARAFKIDRGYVEGAAFKQMEDKRGGAPGSGTPLTGGKKKDDAPKMPEKWLAAGAHDQIPNPRGTRDRREVEVDGEDRRVEETRYERDERRRDTDRRDRDRGRDRSRDRSSGRSSSRRDRSRDRSRSRSRERGTDRFSDRYRPRDRSASRERGRDREGARRSRSRTRSPARKEGEPPKRKGLVDAGSSDSEDTAKAPAAPPAEGKSSDVSSKENRKASGKDTAKKSKRRSRSPSSSSSSSSSSSGSDSSDSDSD